jgi:hypothetical protein
MSDSHTPPEYGYQSAYSYFYEFGKNITVRCFLRRFVAAILGSRYSFRGSALDSNTDERRKFTYRYSLPDYSNPRCVDGVIVFDGDKTSEAEKDIKKIQETFTPATHLQNAVKLTMFDYICESQESIRAINPFLLRRMRILSSKLVDSAIEQLSKPTEYSYITDKMIAEAEIDILVGFLESSMCNIQLLVYFCQIIYWWARLSQEHDGKVTENPMNIRYEKCQNIGGRGEEDEEILSDSFFSEEEDDMLSDSFYSEEEDDSETENTQVKFVSFRDEYSNRSNKRKKVE